MSENKRPLGYLGGDIMSFGSNLARQYEYDKFIEMGLPVDVYSPVSNKSINDKSNMTEEENNVLAEKITAADIERLWNSDFVVIEPAQTAIGTMCELGCLFGWKYMTDRLLDICGEVGTVEEVFNSIEKQQELLSKLLNEIIRINEKDAICYSEKPEQVEDPSEDPRFSVGDLIYRDGSNFIITKDPTTSGYYFTIDPVNKR